MYCTHSAYKSPRASQVSILCKISKCKFRHEEKARMRRNANQQLLPLVKKWGYLSTHRKEHLQSDFLQTHLMGTQKTCEKGFWPQKRFQFSHESPAASFAYCLETFLFAC